MDINLELEILEASLKGVNESIDVLEKDIINYEGAISVRETRLKDNDNTEAVINEFKSFINRDKKELAKQKHLRAEVEKRIFSETWSF